MTSLPVKTKNRIGSSYFKIKELLKLFSSLYFQICAYVTTQETLNESVGGITLYDVICSIFVSISTENINYNFNDIINEYFMNGNSENEFLNACLRL